MKNILLSGFIALILISLNYSQNITNKLGSNGNFIVTDASGNPRYLIVDSQTGNVGIGTDEFDILNPEKFLIDCGNTSSVNAMYVKGSIDDYFQFNIQNLSNGPQASTDIVATADNGTETTNYVNLGINGSGYVYQPWNTIEFGRPDDCYLLAHGKDMYIANSNSSKDILFLVGGTGVANERLRIRYNGRVGIGVSSPSYLLHLNGGAYSNGSSWSNASDSTLKRNVEDLTKYGLADLMKMRSVSYYYKSDSTNKLEIGFIAQELKNIIPEVVSGEEGSMGVSYGNLMPVMVNAIKEQQAQIDKQKQEIDRMKEDIRELKAMNKTQTAGMDEGSFNILYIVILTFAVAITVFFVKRRKQRKLLYDYN